MPADSAVGELASLVAELRAVAQGLRRSAARMSSRSASESGDEIRERELARRARPELERAERRGIDGRDVIERSSPWHRR